MPQGAMVGRERERKYFHELMAGGDFWKAPVPMAWDFSLWLGDFPIKKDELPRLNSLFSVVWIFT